MLSETCCAALDPKGSEAENKLIHTPMHFYSFLLGALAVWRVTHLLNAEDGPFEILERVRRRFGQGMLRSLFDCFYCLSLWVALAFVFAFGETWRMSLLLWPALSAAAILLERITNPERPADAARSLVTYYEDEEKSNDVLR
jgi:hypothetical protein